MTLPPALYIKAGTRFVMAGWPISMAEDVHIGNWVTALQAFDKRTQSPPLRLGVIAFRLLLHIHPAN
ncbi:hypothetical protein R7040_08785 [Vibrio sp. 1069]|nr:hypothetical protein [Vibrio sp. 1069]MDW2331194.1 hypothetical protein [Vibrio sp. 1069]